MIGLVISLLILNAMDCIGTLYGIHHGYAYEANPIMAHLLSLGDAVFVIVKVTVVSLVSLFLYAMRGFKPPVIKVIFICLVAVYAMLNIVHIALFWYVKVKGIE